MHLVTQWWQLQSAGDRASSTSDPCRGALQKVLALSPSHIEGSRSAKGEVSAAQVSRLLSGRAGI